MSFNIRKKVNTRFVELRADGSQTGIGDGTKVKFPTKVTTSGDSVSITSSGVISLSSSKSYYIQVHVSCDRPSSNSDISFEFWNDTSSTKLTRADGAFEARYLPTSGSSWNNGSTIGQLRIDNPNFDLSIRVNQLGSGNSVDILEHCHLFIIEMDY